MPPEAINHKGCSLTTGKVRSPEVEKFNVRLTSSIMLVVFMSSWNYVVWKTKLSHYPRYIYLLKCENAVRSLNS